MPLHNNLEVFFNLDNKSIAFKVYYNSSHIFGLIGYMLDLYTSEYHPIHDINGLINLHTL